MAVDPVDKLPTTWAAIKDLKIISDQKYNAIAFRRAGDTESTRRTNNPVEKETPCRAVSARSKIFAPSDI